MAIAEIIDITISEEVIVFYRGYTARDAFLAIAFLEKPRCEVRPLRGVMSMNNENGILRCIVF